jgi:hypothetical protein
MKTPRASISRLAVWLALLAMILASSVLINGEEAEVRHAQGVAWDWTHHHVVFSHPGSADEALRRGTYEHWLKIVNDPRYIMQQQERSARANVPAATLDRLSGGGFAAAPEAIETGAGRVGAASDADVQQEEAAPIEMSLEERDAHAAARGLPSGLGRALKPQPRKPGSGGPPRGSPPSPRNRRNRIHKDWSESVGSNGTTGLGEFPATFTTGGTSCSDFAIFNTGLAGSGTQASIIAFNNLYSGCTGGPTIYWAYNTGGTIVNSVILSLDGTQVGFVQSSASGPAQLVVLKWAAGGTLTSPTTPASNSSYPNCTAPCMISVPFSGSPTDTYSSPFVSYGATGEPSTIYVGDDAGSLHQFTNIFYSSGTPAEMTTGGWPVVVNSNASLGSPVYDPTSTNVFVGDYLFGSSSPCAPSVSEESGLCGFLYSINSSGTVTTSAQLDYNIGILDSPIVDPNAERVYVFVGDDGSTNCASSTAPCAAVYQYPVGFTSGATGTEATVGPGYEFMMSGTFDNAYFTSAAPPTGHLYVVGNTGPADNTLYQISIASNVMSASTTAGPEVATNYDNDYYSAGLQVTEFYNTSAGNHDYIFLSVLGFGQDNTAIPCPSQSVSEGCIMGFDVTSGIISSSTAATGVLAESGGTSGIVVDNGTAGASNIYFSTLLNQCASNTAGCAVQTSQSAP